MEFEIIGAINEIEVLAAGPGVRILALLHKLHGSGRWRKLKGVAHVRLPNGSVHLVELHWYQAHGIGKRDMKIKHYLED